MYFHTDDMNTVDILMYALTDASANNKRVRIDVDHEGNLTFKVGEGMWSAPIASTPDPYRDNG